MARAKYFTVKGKTAFPFKLLTKNECWPASESDADQLWSGCAMQHPECVVTLVTHCGKVYAPDWAQAGWPVESVSS